MRVLWSGFTWRIEMYQKRLRLLRRSRCRASAGAAGSQSAATSATDSLLETSTIHTGSWHFAMQWCALLLGCSCMWSLAAQRVAGPWCCREMVDSNFKPVTPSDPERYHDRKLNQTSYLRCCRCSQVHCCQKTVSCLRPETASLCAAATAGSAPSAFP